MKGLEWRHLKGLYQIYKQGQTRLKIASNLFVNQILIKQKKIIRFKLGNHAILEKTIGFDSFFEKELLATYEYYNEFFTHANIENDARKTFSEEDLKTLIFIFNQREELKKSITTEYTFSSRVFKKSSKYLSNKPSLRNAVLQLLAITEFPEKDPKNNLWRFVVDCPNPKAIVLCENLTCLKVPLEYKANNIELWYVGGNNTAPLIDMPSEKLILPTFYFCDWDYNGLLIYSRVKKIIEGKAGTIVLIEPSTLDNSLPVNIKHHASKWNPKEFSGLIKSDFTENQIEIINKLIQNDIWVEEESMDMITLLKNYKLN